MTHSIHHNRKSRIEIQKPGGTAHHQQSKGPIPQGGVSDKKFQPPQDNSELKLFKEKMMDLKHRDPVPWWERDPMSIDPTKPKGKTTGDPIHPADQQKIELPPEEDLVKS